MTKLANTASDKAKSATDVTEQVLPSIIITTNPVVITAVQRKVNIGNFETIDIYMGIALPLGEVDLLDQDALQEALTNAAAIGFNVASSETADRYKKVKESITK